MKTCQPLLLAMSILAFFAVGVQAEETSPWRAHDLNRPLPPVVTPASSTAPGRPPSDAIVLFDGSDLSEWESKGDGPTKWLLKDKNLIPTPDAGYIRTRKAFGDVQLHLEWSAPSPPKGDGQGRGNSGVYLMGLYEVQILDSFKNKTYADGQCASLYGQNPPLVNACLPPGEWQAYDIIFRRPRFSADGQLISPAIMTVFQNGVLVQDHFKLWGPTEWLSYEEYEKHADKLPLRLQDHGNPVRFRNIWVRELAETPVYSGLATVAPKTDVEPDTLEKLTGKFMGEDGTEYEVRLNNGQLQLGIPERYFDLVPITQHEFNFKHTFAKVTFDIDDNGQPSGLVVNVMGEKRPAKAK